VSASHADAFHRGARLFDDGDFFAAHEAWEERWLVEREPWPRTLLQGLIQVAAGFHKLRAVRDRASAARLLAKGLAKLETQPEGMDGGSLRPFCDGVRAWRDALAGATGEGEPPQIPMLLAPG
jgi:predicted metal-dependent hydrolase